MVSPWTAGWSGQQGRWLWLQAGEGKLQVLHYRTGGGAALTITRGEGWQDIALDGDKAWILARDRLLRTELREGASPETIASGLKLASGLIAVGGKLYWCETRSARDPALSFITPLGAQVSIRCREPDGNIRELATWPGGNSWKDRGPPRVFGVAAESAFVRIGRLLSTEFLRVPLSGGVPALLAVESGRQTAILHEGQLYWTAPSEEGGMTTDLACIRRAPLTGGPGETVTDWLPAPGTLAVRKNQLYYGGMACYRVPNRFGAAEHLLSTPQGKLVSDGESLLQIDEKAPPRVLGVR